MRQHPRILASAAYLLAFALLSCSDSGPMGIPGPSDDAASITLSQPTATLVPGVAVTLTAAVVDRSGNPTAHAVRWSSSDATRATVSSSGVVTGIAPGPVDILATSSGRTATCRVVVKAGAVIGPAGGSVSAFDGAVSLYIPPAALSGNVMVTVEPATNAPLDARLVGATAVEFGPSGQTFAVPAQIRLRYDPARIPLGVAEHLVSVHRVGTDTWQPVAGSRVDLGTRTVTTEISAFSTYALLAASPVTGLSVSPEIVSLEVGGSTQLIATARNGATLVPDAVITWESEKRSIVSVSASGLVTGLAPGGPVKVRAFTASQIAAAAVTVVARPSLALSTSNVTFTALEGGPSPASTNIDIRNAGGGALDALSASVAYADGQPVGWLSATIGRTNAPAALTLAATTSGLPRGTYLATVSIASPSAANSPANATVSLTIGAGPAISISTSALNASATSGGANPAPQSVRIVNAGGGTLSGLSASVSYAGGAVGWLTAELSATTAPATLTLQAVTGSLPVGERTATVTVRSAVTGVPDRTLAFVFTVSAAPVPPSIGLSSDDIAFTETAGAPTPAAQSVNVANTGGGTLSGLAVSVTYGAGEPTGWLGASLSGSTAPATLSLRASAASLPPGSYTATVQVSSPVASGPQSIAVSFIVAVAPSISVTPSAIAFSAVAGAGNPAAQTASIVSTGGGTVGGLAATVSYAPSQPTGWLAASLSGASAPGDLLIQATTGALVAGTYSATISIASSLSGVASRTVSVTFTVNAATVSPAIGLSATTTRFTATSGGAAPAAQTVSITNAGGGTLTDLVTSVSYVAGQPAGWLSASLGGTTAPATITLRATTGVLAAGTYTGTVTVSSSVASNSGQSIAVTFSVADAPPVIDLAATSATFRATAGAENPAPTTIAITNVGGSTLRGLAATVAYNAGQPSGWLAATLNSATAPTQVTLSATTGTLTAGTYTATVTVSSSVAGVSPRTIAVSFAVASAPPPPTGEPWHRVVANVTIQGDLVVPDGEKWLIGPGVQIAGNLRTVGGTIALRPGSSLKFLGANPDEYIGGGLTFAPAFARDIGLWVGPQGVLDIQGTPKTGWNRTGVDPTWMPGDEYWITPTAGGDYAPRRWTPGQPVPQADPRVPAAEIINVTRDIVIEGPGHIHIHSSKPQRIEYVTLRRMGISNSRSDGPVIGRYALHLHLSADGSRGTIIRGVAAVNSEGHVYVPHASHGVTMIDNVSVNSYADAFWWDQGDQTNDLLVDRLAISGVVMPREITGSVSRFDAATLGLGTNMEIRNSAVSGARTNKLSVGFNWSSTGAPRWIFQQGNVAHNNTGPGLRFWLNQREPHHVHNTITYRNGEGGIENGAYANSVRYTNVLLVDDYIKQNSNSKLQNVDHGPARYTNVKVYSREGPALRVGTRNLAGDSHLEFVDCVLQAGPGAPKVYVGDGKSPWLAHFIRSGVTPDDIVFESLSGENEGSHILIDHEDGRKWEILVQDGQKIVRTR